MAKPVEKPKKFFWTKKKNDKSGNKSDKKDLLKQKSLEIATQDRDVGNEEFVPPDGGWGWVVCLTSLWVNGTVFGIINTFGIVYVQMREHYAKDNPEVSLKTAFVGSACTGVTFLMCTVSSILSDRIGIRPTAMTGAVLATAGLVASAFVEKLEMLYLTYGLLLGIGSSMMYSPSLVILGHYFKKHMGLVNGIVSFGSALFTLCLTRILPYLLNTIGISNTFLFLSALEFAVVVLSLSWKPVFRKQENMARMTLSTESVYRHCENCCTWTRRFLNVKIWKNRAYVTWVLSLGVALFGYFIPFFHLPQYTKDTFPTEDGSWLIMCLSITSGISRIVFGKLADFKCVSRLHMQQLAFFVLGISTLCIPFATSFGGLIVISLVMGVCDGIFVCLLGPIAFDIVGPNEASQAIGFLMGSFSIPFTIGPPVAGWLYDYMGNYRVAFHAAGAPPILGAIMMFLIPKVEQNFPAVTEAQEFASISMLDVFNETRVHRSRQHLATKNGPSGPLMELEFVRSRELLYLGSSKSKLAEEGRLPEADHNTSHKQDTEEQPTRIVKGEVESHLENTSSYDSEKEPVLHAKKVDTDTTTNTNSNNRDNLIDSKSHVPDSHTDIKSMSDDELDNEYHSLLKDLQDDNSSVSNEDSKPSTVAEHGHFKLESSSLMDEMEKYLEPNRFSSQMNGYSTT